MKKITIDELQSYGHLTSESRNVSYCDPDLLVARNVDASMLFKEDRLNMEGKFVVLCTKGILTLCLNNEKISISENDLFFCHSMQVVEIISCSADFKCDILVFSLGRFSGISIIDGKIIKNILFLKENPVMSISDRCVMVLESYFELFEKKYKILGDRIGEKRTSNYLLVAMLQELVNMIDQERIRTKGTNVQLMNDEILHRFFILLTDENVKHHTVRYFADKLYVTPKYLSAKCSKATGKTPSQWIRDVLVEKIRYMLLCTNYPIKEIANTLEFPNVSFFGRYVKEHLGCSPAEFRRTNK